MPISATGDLEHDLAPASRRLGELRERVLELLEAERVRHETARVEGTVVQKRDNSRPRGGRVAEARCERQVVVHEEVARELERRAGGRKPELQGRAAAAYCSDRCCDRVGRACRLDREVEAGWRRVEREARRAEPERQLLLLRASSSDDELRRKPQ